MAIKDDTAKMQMHQLFSSWFKSEQGHVVVGSLLVLRLFTQPPAHYALILPSVSISRSVLRLRLCSLNLAKPVPLDWVCDYFIRETWYCNLLAAALLALQYFRPWHGHINNTSRSSKEEDTDEWLQWPVTIPVCSQTTIQPKRQI